jgi:hypothetical protein
MQVTILFVTVVTRHKIGIMKIETFRKQEIEIIRNIPSEPAELFLT